MAQHVVLNDSLNNPTLNKYGYIIPWNFAAAAPRTAAGFNRRMRKTACPVVWKGHGANSPWPRSDPNTSSQSAYP